MDILEHLTQEHRKAESLLAKLAESDEGPVRQEALDELRAALTVHMAVEERFVYPIVEDALGDEAEAEAENEHLLAREGLQKLDELVSEPGFGAAVAMLQGGLGHHVEEEEKEIFPKLRERAADRITQLDPERLEAQVTSASDLTKEQLYEQAQKAEIPGRSRMTKDELANAVNADEA